MNRALKQQPKAGVSAAAGSGAVIFDSGIGWLGIEWAGETITRTTIGDRSPQTARRRLSPSLEASSEPPGCVHELAERMRLFVAGHDDDFLDVVLADDHLTGFQKRVIDHCRRIPIGQLRTYGQLARLAGSPRAARAVGNVMASNRYPLIVPCHRVVAANGALGGFSAPAGLELKRRLLQREGSWSALA